MNRITSRFCRWTQAGAFLLLACTKVFSATFEIGDITVAKPTNPEGYLEAKVNVGADMPSLNVGVTAHYFSEDDKPLATVVASPRVHKGESKAFVFPPVLKRDDDERVRFEIPLVVRLQSNWKVVVCFGDKNAVVAKRWPTGSFEKLEFPEKKLLSQVAAIVRPNFENPLDEEVCPISLQDYPRMTLFAKLPSGLAQGESPAGVLCISALAGGLDELRRQMQGDSDDGSMKLMLRYARKNKLMVICWGARSLWAPGKNWDDLPPAEAARIDDRFSKVAMAWEKGVNRLTTKYAVKPDGFLLWGYSDSAQFAKRLALHKPQYFRAAYIHEPNSFDKPTPQAASIMWCLTVGELDGGYPNSIRFFKKCQQLDYPMIYKVIPGLGHSTHLGATTLAMHWFDYARTMPESARERIKVQVRLAFSPPFIGDYLNQEMAPSATGQWIPQGQRVPLPTELIAKAWNLEKVPDPSEIPNEVVAANPVQPAVADVAKDSAMLAKWANSEKWPKEWRDWCVQSTSLKSEGAPVRVWPTPPNGVKMPEELKELKAAYDTETKRIRDSDTMLTFVFAKAMRDAGDPVWPLPADPSLPVQSNPQPSAAVVNKSTPAEVPAQNMDSDNTVFGRRVH